MFGEATYRFNPNWAVTAGLRYYDFSEDRLLTFAGLFADQGYTDQPGSVESDGFSPRVILAYNVDKNVQFTAQYSRGFRLGGINDPLNVGLCADEDLVTYSGFENWDDEFVDNFEIGTKTRLADGRVTFNASVFVTRIDGLQVIADAGTCSSRIIINADAETPGAEFELFVRPEREPGISDSRRLTSRRRSPSRSWRPADRWPASGKAISCRLRRSCRPWLRPPTTGRWARHGKLSALHRAVRRFVVHAAG